ASRRIRGPARHGGGARGEAARRGAGPAAAILRPGLQQPDAERDRSALRGRGPARARPAAQRPPRGPDPHAVGRAGAGCACHLRGRPAGGGDGRAGGPLAVGLLGVAAGMAVTGILARVMPVSAYAANVVSMIGLGVAIDYSLFVVSRHREELVAHPPAQALARTLATAGRTVVFSGMTVGIGLLGMILLRMGSVSTIGIASTVVVGFAVLYSLTLLPALLVILGPRVNALSLWRRPARPGARSDLWHRLATAAMARPWHVLVPVVLVLVVLGLPFRHIHLGTPGVSTLPAKAESRRGQGLLAREFPQLEPNSIVVVLRYPDRSGL